MAIASSLLQLELASLPSLWEPRSWSTFTSFGLPPPFFNRIRLSSYAKLPRGKLPGTRAIEQNDALFSDADEDEELKRRLQELEDSLKLPSDYLGKLPRDLRVDLTDAAYALSSGSLKQECGTQVGEILMQLSRSWEQANTQDSMIISKSISYLHHVLPNDISSRAAIGRRFVKSGGFLIATGQYGRGELQKIGNALIAAGKALSTSSTEAKDVNDAVDSLRILKFGDLQVEVTSARAFTGSIIAFLFGVFSWKLASALQSIPENSIYYSNDNAVILATSLRGVLLALGYSSAALSAFVMLGLVVLGIQLTNKK